MNIKKLILILALAAIFPTIAWADDDGDGIDAPTDCNDANDQIFPGAIEICNDVDDDCNGLVDDGPATTIYYEDSDGDTYGNASVSVTDCSLPTGYVVDDTDCDDTDATISPAAAEICDGEDNNCDLTIDESFADTDVDGTADCVDTEECDALDNDGDGETDEGVTSTFYEDSDGDLFGDAASTVTGCTAPLGYVADNTDCDATTALRFPGNDEDCDGIDNDCDGTTEDEEGDEDADGTLNCDDTEECDNVDNDGDGDVDEGVTTTFYEDADGDTFGNPDATSEACTVPYGYVTDDTDCDDTVETISTDATEICGDDIDQDCDDDDLACEEIPAVETCDDEMDNDEDALIDCDDGDCLTDTTCTAISEADDISSSSSSGCQLNKMADSKKFSFLTLLLLFVIPLYRLNSSEQIK